MNYTKKIQTTINEKFLQEKQLRAKYAESYTANVNHEMRTPLATILFFLAYVIKFIELQKQ